MRWNWEQSDWPEFTWEPTAIRKAEARFLMDGGGMEGIQRFLGGPEREQLAIEAMSAEALKTSEIEGELLDRISVQSSVRRQLGLAADRKKVKPSEQGIAEMMVNLYRTSAQPLSEETLFTWHRMVMKGREDLRHIGGYRTDSEPMQVVSGRIYAPKVHFEAPPSARVPKEMARFVKWFNRSTPGGRNPMPALTRAGIAHLYFESIHPFEDGNGRIGRAIAEKTLAQALGHPTFTALSTTILAHKKEYYTELEIANKSNKLTRWLRWFAAIVIEAQRRTQSLMEFLIDKTRLLDRLRGRLNPRQEKALFRMLREGPDGFKGGLSAANYMTITGAPTATTTRDLADLVEKGALIRTGERRYARYALAIPLREVKPVRIARDGSVT